MNKGFFRLGLLLLFLSGAISHSFAQTELLSKKEHKAILEKYKQTADKFTEKNLNRFAIDEFHYYETALDTFFKTEMKDTLASFSKNYQVSHHDRIALATDLNQQITSFEQKNDEAKANFSALVRRFMFIAIVWLAVIIVLFVLRRRALSNANEKLEESEILLSTSEKQYQLGNELIEYSTHHVKKAGKVEEIANEIAKTIVQNPLVESLSKEEQTLLKSKVKLLTQNASVNKKVFETAISQKNAFGNEKVLTDINKLSDQCMDLISQGLKDEAFTVAVTKDLEKNLPKIKVIPEAVVHLLLIVLTNAFDAVNEKQKEGAKSYTPKVTISTRILPQFLQIRIKDNGNGMSDKIISRMSEPFFTTRQVGEGSGLGMYFAKQIVSEMHKGEIKIESQPGNGTDVYVKFFVA